VARKGLSDWVAIRIASADSSQVAALLKIALGFARARRM